MSQKEKILNHLKSGRGITPLDALKLYGCFRLAAIIHNLKQEGCNIETEMMASGGKKFANYKIKYEVENNQYSFK